MRLSHSSLEDCRRNPTRWAQANPIGQRPVRRIGYARIAKLAIYRYHKGTERARARAYLLQACQRNGLNNTRRIDAATATLDSYIDWAEQNDPVVADVMIRVELNLGSELLLGGEVSRVDVNRRGGYSAILLDPPPEGWREQLRMPLLQSALARRYRRDERDIAVGFQDPDGGRPIVATYSARDLLNAAEEARTLAARVAAVWRRP
jgi:hypothetical protein